MAEVLLTHSNHLWSDRKQIEKMQPYPPLQTLLAAAFLREHGIAPALYDPTLETPAASTLDSFAAALDRHQPRMVVVCEDDFNFLSKMCLMRNRELAFQFAEISRRRGIPVVVHGSDASDNVEKFLRAGFSFVALGEVEITLLELVRNMPPQEIRGLAFQGPLGVVRTAPRAVRNDLDSLPLPAWDLIDAARYRAAWIDAHGYFSLNMASSRGCPYRCNWCAKPIHGQNYHVRSAAAVAAEMSHLKRTLEPDNIWFADDIFALSPRWTFEFARAVEALDARIPFRMQSRCDLMTREIVSALKQAGCSEVWMGAESGSQKILDAMDKGIRVEEIAAARENLRRHGIRACFFLQFGYPGEEWSDIEATIQMVRNVQPDDIGVSVSYPLPGTRFHEAVARELSVHTNWSDSADLAMMFRGTYTTDFYRALADALHLEVRGGRDRHASDQAAAWQRVKALEPISVASEMLAQ
jgi:anaerobic magnesium-protoporphyrin IX monomethyl ester cyclase